MSTRRVAVVGAGISGLATAWLLSRRHRVTLYEAAEVAGGHTNTVDVTVDGATFPVDTGFLVFNDRTYPNLCALFSLLGVESTASDMSFSVRIDGEDLEWAGTSLASVFAQKRNLLNPSFWSMLKDILRFNRDATDGLRRGTIRGSLESFLDAGRYGRPFRDWYLLPMSAAIWSCPPARMLEHPAEVFLRFCHNHGLLQIADRPLWRTVVGGGREYVRRLLDGIDDVRLGTPVHDVLRGDACVVLRAADGTSVFDDVVFATHTDVTRRLLTDADTEEESLLAAIRYQDNEAWLHTDSTLLPRAREAWAAWNYLAGAQAPGAAPVSVSYLINRLQPLPCRTPIVVTLNPPAAPREDTVLRRMQYSHPVFDAAAVAAQGRLHVIQGRRRTWYCGAWTGHGFHEDGLRSALAVAEGFGITAPWLPARVAA